MKAIMNRILVFSLCVGSVLMGLLGITVRGEVTRGRDPAVKEDMEETSNTKGAMTVPITVMVVPHDIKAGLPTAFVLSQNYPNPFNPTTTITYSIPEANRVNLEIFNILGRRVETLVDEFQIAGFHSCRWNAEGYASGTYLYRLTSGSHVLSKKMQLVK